MFEQQLQQHAAILAQIQSGKFKQIQILDIDCSLPGRAPGAQRGVFEVEGNGIFLLSSYYDLRQKTELTSSTQVRVSIHFNREDAPGLCFSHVGTLSSASTTLTDFGAAVLTFQKLIVNVITNLAAQHLYFAVLKGVNLFPGQTSLGLSSSFGGGSGQSGAYGG